MREDVNGWWWVPVTQCSGQVGVNDEHAIAWPVQAFARGSGNSSSGRGMWVGGGEKTSSDGTMFGNGWLPNIVIIINQ
jgi:hypothetical protein